MAWGGQWKEVQYPCGIEQFLELLLDVPSGSRHPVHVVCCTRLYEDCPLASLPRIDYAGHAQASSLPTATQV
jgi:hypothetical protein